MNTRIFYSAVFIAAQLLLAGGLDAAEPCSQAGPQAPRDIETLGRWCGTNGGGNVFAEDHAHGVRALVTNLRLLSLID